LEKIGKNLTLTKNLEIVVYTYQRHFVFGMLWKTLSLQNRIKVFVNNSQPKWLQG